MYKRLVCRQPAGGVFSVGREQGENSSLESAVGSWQLANEQGAKSKRQLETGKSQPETRIRKPGTLNSEF